MPDPAQTLGPYRLERVLGTGSFATVWLARDDMLDRYLAVKILADNWSQDHDVRRRFLAEAKVLLTVDSGRIVRGFHLGETDGGQPYLVMAWADRGTLEDRLDARRREDHHFTVAEVVALGREITRAVADVHQSGHLHRDIKPSNVLIRSTQGSGPVEQPLPGLAADETLLLGDFGLARGIDVSALTLVAGSPGYVAPEQAAGLSQLDHRADLYSVGRIMLELLTGDAGGRATTMARAATERIDVGALVEAMGERGLERPPPRLVELLSRLVAEDPGDRPDSATDVVVELDAIAAELAHPAAGGGGGEGAAPPAPPVPSGSGDAAGSPRRRKVVAVLAVVCVLALAVLIPLVRGLGRSGGDEAAMSTEATPTEPASTAPPATEPAPATEPRATEPPPTEPPPTEPPPTEPPPEPLTLPVTAGVLSGDSVDEQSGVFATSVDAFIAGIEDANAGWELVDDAAIRAADDGGTVVFRSAGTLAVIEIEPTALTAGPGVYRFTITYDVEGASDLQGVDDEEGGAGDGDR